MNAEPAMLPMMRFGREICGDLATALRREWLVTNGLGSYASGTIAGPATRRYHGVLVAALAPPVDRVVLVGALRDRVHYRGVDHDLYAFQFADGSTWPRGYQLAESFALMGLLPTWIFAIDDALVARTIWMAHGRQTTHVAYHVLRASAPLQITVEPLVTARDFHTLEQIDPHWQPAATIQPLVATIPMPGKIPPLRMVAQAGAWQPHGEMVPNLFLAEEQARGLDTTTELWAVARAPSPWLAAGASYFLACTIETDDPPEGEAALGAERERQMALLRRANAHEVDALTRRLVLAADQCIVARDRPDGSRGTTVIAGYHWFNDWGRDTMIALPGLTLATGRAEDGADILRSFAPYLQDGLLPNNFPDRAGVVPGYNTVDATLWYVVALWHFFAATGDRGLVGELLPTLRDTIAHHLAGTRFGIGVDPADGLLRQGEPGVQLTWMDAKIGEWVVTPRTGKPVEIQALWYNVLRIAAEFRRASGDPEADRDAALAGRVRASFRARFLPAGGLSLAEDRLNLADVVDGPEGDDWSVRPNQIFALALPFPLLAGDEARAVLTGVGRDLLTSYGLRSLAPGDPRYSGTYGGDQVARDRVYHQGPVWSWLSGAYAEALWRATGDAAGARAILAPFADHLADAGLGTISEIFEGDPPHHPRGAIAQAWSVAEILRVWRLIA